MSDGKEWSVESCEFCGFELCACYYDCSSRKQEVESYNS